MGKILIVKLGSTLPLLKRQRGDFEDWIMDGSGLASSHFQVVRVAAGESLPNPAGQAAVILTGSHDMVTDHQPWSEATAQWLQVVLNYEVPLLGICYGHQLLAHALGGTVGANPQGLEMGLAEIKLTPAGIGDPLFKDLPGEFMAYVSHSQSVLRRPQDAVLLAKGRRVDCYAMAWGRKAWGVQFHPEFDDTILGAYVAAFVDQSAPPGSTPAARADRLEIPVLSSIILKRFVEIALESGTRPGSASV